MGRAEDNKDDQSEANESVFFSKEMTLMYVTMSSQ